MLVAAPLQRQEEHDNRGADQHKSREVERLDSCGKDLPWGKFRLRLGDAKEQKQDGDHTSDREVDVETWIDPISG